MAVEVTPLPVHGEVFNDSRGGDRTCRVSWRAAEGVFVISTWHGTKCAASFRLSRSELPAFVSALLVQLSESPGEQQRSA